VFLQTFFVAAHLQRRIAFGSAPDMAKPAGSSAASGLQIRDTAEFNSALL